MQTGNLSDSAALWANDPSFLSITETAATQNKCWIWWFWRRGNTDSHTKPEGSDSKTRWMRSADESSAHTTPTVITLFILPSPSFLRLTLISNFKVVPVISHVPHMSSCLFFLCSVCVCVCFFPPCCWHNWVGVDLHLFCQCVHVSVSPAAFDGGWSRRVILGLISVWWNHFHHSFVRCECDFSWFRAASIWKSPPRLSVRTHLRARVCVNKTLPPLCLYLQVWLWCCLHARAQHCLIATEHFPSFHLVNQSNNKSISCYKFHTWLTSLEASLFPRHYF